MPIKPPTLPEDPTRYLELVGLMGLMRVSMFEAFGDRKFWDERFFDLFTSMLAKQLRGSVSTLEEMTAAISGVSHSTKVRMIEDARRHGLIEAVSRAEIELERPLETTSARKVFFLSEGAMAALVEGLDGIAGDVLAFAERNRAEGA